MVKKDYFLLSIYLNLFNKGPEIFFCITRGLLLSEKILYTDSLKNNYGNANENDQLYTDYYYDGAQSYISPLEP